MIVSAASGTERAAILFSTLKNNPHIKTLTTDVHKDTLYHVAYRMRYKIWVKPQPDGTNLIGLKKEQPEDLSI